MCHYKWWHSNIGVRIENLWSCVPSFAEPPYSAPSTFEVFIEGVRSEASQGINMEPLTTAETQHMLGRLLHHCIGECVSVFCLSCTSQKI